jgi:iron complex transport system substrate-binding protein
MRTSQFFILVLIFCGCQNITKEVESLPRNSTSVITRAEKFRLDRDQIIIKEPWPGAKHSQNFQIKNVPQRVIVTSTTHLPYLELLGLEDRLVGFPGTQYISSSILQERVNKGFIKDLGPNGNLNLELLIGLEPDLVVAFDMGNESSILDKIEEAGIPVIYNSDFLETTALGRAEWIKFFGALFDKEAEADSIFNLITSNYNKLKKKCAKVTERPTVLSGVMYGDAWFLPGGKNWAATFYQDAGGQYLWKDDTNTGWLELSFESVLEKAKSADFWIGTSTFNTRQELLNQDVRYSKFDAYEKDKIYSYNKRISEAGGYDFFESAYARPDIVLADLIYLLHPELMENYETYYFQKLP